MKISRINRSVIFEINSFRTSTANHNQTISHFNAIFQMFLVSDESIKMLFLFAFRVSTAVKAEKKLVHE